MEDNSLRFDSRSEILEIIHIQRRKLAEQQSLLAEFSEMVEGMEGLRAQADSISAAADGLTETSNALQKDADSFFQKVIMAKECRIDRDLFRRSLRVSSIYSQKICNQIEELKSDVYKLAQVLTAMDDSLDNLD